MRASSGGDVKQPALGIAATAIVIAISFGFIALWDFGPFNGWVSFFTMSFIPFEVMAGVLWNGRPPFLAAMRQPARGAALIALTLAVGVLVSQVVYRTLGASQGEPGPMLAFFSICVIVTTFFWTIAFGGWPFTALVRNPVGAGLLTWAACYAVGGAIYWTACNFEYLRGAPVYVASADPHGLFNAWNVVVYYMSALTVLFSWLCFDLWPLTLRPGMMKQPTLGVTVTGTSLALGYAIFWIGVTVMGVQNVEFLLRVPIAVIFGTILTLNMCQHSAPLVQPQKGAATLAVSAVAGSLLLAAYQWLEPAVSGALPPGPEAFQREQFQVWTANALLAVTFPFLVFYAAYLNFWPLAGATRSTEL
jgi:hypothetical protein